MLNEIEVSSSTFTPTNNLKARTDNVRPLAWMIFIFTLSCFGVAISLNNLKQFQPPVDPVTNQFFLTEGTHYWVLRTDGKCEGYIVGGWKKSKKSGEWIWFKFSVPSQENLVGRSGALTAKFGEYKNLSTLNARINDKLISFDGKAWSGIKTPTKELILMVDAPKGRRHLKLPSLWDREFDSLLSNYINNQRMLDEVDRNEFNNCVRELRK